MYERFCTYLVYTIIHFRRQWRDNCNSERNRVRESSEWEMGRSSSCGKDGLRRGPWTDVEDQILLEYVREMGETIERNRWVGFDSTYELLSYNAWMFIKYALFGAGLNRYGNRCRLRRLNYQKPDIKRGNITEDEEDLIIRLHKLLGNRYLLLVLKPCKLR